MSLDPAQKLQSLVDVRLDEQYCNSAGTHETAGRANGYGYHAGSQLMGAASQTAAQSAGAPGGAGGYGKPAGIPVKPDELRVYAQRVMRPGQVQQFGVVILVSFITPEGNGGTGDNTPAPDVPGTISAHPAPCSGDAGEGGSPDVTEWCAILAASANSLDVLGVEAETLIDSDFFDPDTSPFEDDTLASLRRAFASNDLEVQAPLVGTMRHLPRKAFLILHRTEEGIVIDIEPIDEDVSTILQGSLHTHSLAKSAVSRLQHLAGGSVMQQFQATVEEVQKLTGYDRVMMYKFHPDCHGEVVAEVMSRRVPDSMFGLHFPATDIPQANRSIFMKMRSRLIADVSRPSVKVLHSLRLAENIILAGSQLRGVTGCHAQYLQNMGVHATLVLSIVTGTSNAQHTSPWEGENGKKTGGPPPRSPLWGLLVCHHYGGPYRVNYDHRAAVEFLIKVFSLQLGRSLDVEAHAGQEKVVRMQTAICDILKVLEEPGSQPEHLSATLAKTLFHDPHAARIMLQVADSTGCAMMMEDTWHTAGTCPMPEELDRLLEWLTSGHAERRRLKPGGHWGTISLAKEGYPDAKAIRSTSCGLLAVDLLQQDGQAPNEATPARPKCGYILWMRCEMMQTQTWAGDRHSAPARAMGHEMSPRASFEAMKELVELECVPWTAAEVEGTHSVKLLLQDAIRLCEEGLITSRILVAINKERLRNMDELTKVANELQAVIRTADVPIIKLDANLRVLDFNTHAAQFFADAPPVREKERSDEATADSDKPTGRPFASFLEPESRLTMEEILRPAVNDGAEPEPFQVKFRAMPGNDTAGSTPNSGILCDANSEAKGGSGGGSKQEVLLFVHIKRDFASGRVDQLVCVCRDMSMQANLMRQVSARERDCEELMEHSASAMFCVDTEARVTGWNTAMERVSGVEQGVALGKSLLGELLGPGGLLVQIPYGGSGDVMTELSALLVDVLSMQYHPHLPSAAAPELLKPKDLTLPKALEKAIAVQMAAEAAADAKTRHIAFLCHEIRNPVNGILATVQAIEDLVDLTQQTDSGGEDDGIDGAVDNTEMLDLVRTTLACTDQLRRTVDGILDLNKMEEGKLELQQSWFRVPNVMRTVLNQVISAASEKELTVDAALVDERLRDMKFLGDEVRIQQILANFCWNSVKFTSQGGLRIEVEAEPGSRPGFMRLFWKVIDTGKGMTQQTQESLFERFAMGKHKVGKYGGSGLGLSICRSLAELMQGHLHCMSTLGQGSTFILELELAVDDKPEEKVKPAPVVAVAPVLQPAPVEPGPMEPTVPLSPLQPAISQASGRHKSNQPGAPPPQSSAQLSMRSLRDAISMLPPMSAEEGSAPEGRRKRLPPPRKTSATVPEGSPDKASEPAPAPAPAADPVPAPAVVPQPQLPNGTSGALTVSQRWEALSSAGSEPSIPSCWGWTVVREVVETGSVAVLVEVQPGGDAAARQFWGGAVVGAGGVGVALGAATEDALRRVLALSSDAPASGTGAPVRQQSFSLQTPPSPRGAALLSQPRSRRSSEHSAAEVAKPALRRKPVRSRSSISNASKSADPLASPAPSLGPPNPEFPVQNVLVVDDDNINLKVLHRALTRGGIKVTLGEDGQDVIRLLINEGQVFDMLLVDENMRHMNGSTAARALRKHELKNGMPPMPVFATTGNSAPHDLARYYGCGLDGMFTKPMNMREIVGTLHAYARYRREHYTPQQPVRTYGMALMSPPRTDELGDGIEIRHSETFVNSMIMGGLEVFGTIRESMRGIMAAEAMGLGAGPLNK